MTDKTFLVRDYMHATISIKQDGATLRRALATMVEAKRNGVFVVDTNNHVVGVITTWDIIEHVVPDYLESDKHLAPFESGDVLIERVIAVADDSIELFMTKKVHVVHENSSVMEVATMLSEFHLRQLPVVNDENKLVGCINRTDVKLIIAEILNIHE